MDKIKAIFVWIFLSKVFFIFEGRKMNKQQIQRLIASTIIFAVIFWAILFFVGIPGVETTGMKITAIIIASFIFFVISYLLRKKTVYSTK